MAAVLACGEGAVLSHTLIARDCTIRDGIPVTTPSRTLADLRGLLSAAGFGAVVREAEFRRLPIEGAPDASRTRSELEALFIAVVRRHRLPVPEANGKVGGYEVDFLWRAERLIVEVDGWEAHRTRSAFEEDRVRDAHLMALGFDVLRSAPSTAASVAGPPRRSATTSGRTWRPATSRTGPRFAELRRRSRIAPRRGRAVLTFIKEDGARGSIAALSPATADRPGSV